MTCAAVRPPACGQALQPVINLLHWHAFFDTMRITMLDRRRALQGGLAAVGSLSVGAPFAALAQRKPAAKVRYNEVVRSILYAPAYVAMDQRLLQGGRPRYHDGDRAGRRQVDGGAARQQRRHRADRAGEPDLRPDRRIRRPRCAIFCGLTSTDGFMLVGRQKVDKFDWSMLKGKEILGFRPGSTPLLFFEAAMRQNGIDPHKDVKLVNNVAIPARVGSWLAGQNQFAIFIEPDASQLELDGKAHFMASIGQTVGFADYTSFMATDKYIKENPEVCRPGPTRSPRE